MTRYIAGWNMAGYLPETEPEIFDTIEDARAYLVETVEVWLDQDYETAEARGANGGADPDATGATIIEAGDDWADGWYGDFHFWAEPYTEEVTE